MRSTLRLLFLTFYYCQRTFVQRKSTVPPRKQCSGIGNEATCGIRDMRRMETDNEFERPTEHPEETNRKSRQLFPVSSTSHMWDTMSSLQWDLNWQFFSFITISAMKTFRKHHRQMTRKLLAEGGAEIGSGVVCFYAKPTSVSAVRFKRVQTLQIQTLMKN